MRAGLVGAGLGGGGLVRGGRCSQVFIQSYYLSFTFRDIQRKPVKKHAHVSTAPGSYSRTKYVTDTQIIILELLLTDTSSYFHYGT